MDVDKIQQKLAEYQHEYVCAVNKARKTYIQNVLGLVEELLSESPDEANKIQLTPVKITMEEIERSARDLGITIPKQSEV